MAILKLYLIRSDLFVLGQRIARDLGMTDPHLIGPTLDSAPGEPWMRRARVRSLPYDLLKEASRRLEIMSLLAASLWVLGTVAGRWSCWTESI
jgi:hypothetical protein